MNQVSVAKYLVGAIATFCIAANSYAAFVEERFDDGSASGRFSAPFFSSELGSDPNTDFDGFVDYAFDYSTVGISPAPGTSGGTTIGLGIQVNNTDQPADEGEAIGVSPLLPASLPSDYDIRVDAFIYYGGGGGSSEHAVLGVNADQTAVPFTWVPGGAGQFYHIPHNSGLSGTSYADDYYRAADGVITKLYDGDPNFGAPDADSIGIFPANGDDPVFNDEGFPGNQWMILRLAKTGSLLEVSIDGVPIDTYDIGAGASAGDVVLAGADIFNSANSTNWIVFDNLVIYVPEPASLSMLSIGLVPLCWRRRTKN